MAERVHGAHQGQLAVPFTLRSLLYRHLRNLRWAQSPCVVLPLPEDIFGLCHSLASPYRRGAHNIAVMTKSRLLRGGSGEPLRAELWIQAASLAPTTFVTLSELFNLCFCFSLCKKSVWEEKYLAVLKWDCHGIIGGKNLQTNARPLVRAPWLFNCYTCLCSLNLPWGWP